MNKYWKRLTHVAMILVLLLPASAANTEIKTLATLDIVMPEKKIKKAKAYNISSFKGFKVIGAVNANVTKDLEAALETYSGPEAIITSLRRHWNTHSAHTHGNAVDFMWNDALIEWLGSENGLSWLNQHNLMYYIEGKPGSSKVRKYLASDKFRSKVFENPGATGNHIHIQIKK